jgi:Uncharacterized protein involved in biosynthesis of c-type cytochromes
MNTIFLVEPALTRWISCLLLCACFTFSLPLEAADVPFEFRSVEQEQRYKELIDELRCLVCQNQSLADSHADLAQDLRNEVYQMIIDGKSDAEITGFLVSRYGEFVLFRPPLKPVTLLLWAGPFLMLIIAIFVVFRLIQKNARQTIADLNSGERQRLDELLRQAAQREQE